MKRELVILVVIGSLLWAVTGISVLAVSFLERGRPGSGTDRAQTDVVPAAFRADADARARDDVTSAPLCESAPSDRSVSDPGEPDLRRAGTDAAETDCDTCWQGRAVAALRLCFLLA
jgi:hypothetical protein